MKIGFLVNQIDYRGTGNAAYDYAHYNEEVLGNKSYIMSYLHPPNGAVHNSVEQIVRWSDRFGRIYFMEDGIPTALDAIYHIKAGHKDMDLSPVLPYWVHAVFDGSQPHGNRYAVISRWMSAIFDQPFVPHIVAPPKPGPSARETIRSLFNIPPKATVIGRIGADSTFDIDWAWEAILASLEMRDDLYYLFIGPVDSMPIHSRIRSVPLTVDPQLKSDYISICDAMVHARSRGETFGLACAEFAAQGLPIITYKHSREQAHILELEYQPPEWFYSNYETLLGALLMVGLEDRSETQEGYIYDPESVMWQFKKVFIDGYSIKFARSTTRITRE